MLLIFFNVIANTDIKCVFFKTANAPEITIKGILPIIEIVNQFWNSQKYEECVFICLRVSMLCFCLLYLNPTDDSSGLEYIFLAFIAYLTEMLRLGFCCVRFWDPTSADLGLCCMFSVMIVRYFSVPLPRHSWWGSWKHLWFYICSKPNLDKQA